MFTHLWAFLPFATLPFVLATSLTPPSVQLDSATFTGAVDGKTHKFLGIPYAKPPVGDLRFRLPVANNPYNGSRTVVEWGSPCPQEKVDFDYAALGISSFLVKAIESIYSAIVNENEDCLTLNVWAPANLPEGAKVPVVVWIFPGAFEVGSTTGSAHRTHVFRIRRYINTACGRDFNKKKEVGSTASFDGARVVNHAVKVGKPIIYVSMNYRLNAFGFLGGKEVKAAGVGNLGLHDQRQAMRWVQKYISAFGGDPGKVTLWGESAGGISASLHMLANNGDHEGLFRGVFKQSGSPLAVGDITRDQGVYDQIVENAGCKDVLDTLQCLREVELEVLKAEIRPIPASWLPKADGAFITDLPFNLLRDGVIADVPVVTGNNDDEGTLFTLQLRNITTDDEFRTYIYDKYLYQLTSDEMDQVMELYPSDHKQGAPYNTGSWNKLTPQFKRLASLQGDLIFEAPRRYFLQQRADKQKIWAYLNTRLKWIPTLGSFHGSDLLNTYGGGDMADYLINFAYFMDPNGLDADFWPTYDTLNPQLLTFYKSWVGRDKQMLSPDDHRTEPIDYLMNISSRYPF